MRDKIYKTFREELTFERDCSKITTLKAQFFSWYWSFLTNTRINSYKTRSNQWNDNHKWKTSTTS